MALMAGSLETDPSWAAQLGAFRVRLRHLRIIAGERVPVEVSASVDQAGAFRIEVDNDARADPAASLSVLGPTGETLAGALLADLADGPAKLKPVRVNGKAPRAALTAAPAGPALRRLTLRLFRSQQGANSGQPAAGLPVRLLAAARAEDAPAPLASGTSDASGYIALTIPAAPVARLVAAIGSGDKAVEHALALAPDGSPPGRAVLVVTEEAGPTEETDECHCDTPPPRLPDATELAENGDVYSADLGAGCADLTIPNRTVEEFDYYRIVRTTDPDIQGLTLPEEVTAGAAADSVAKLVFDRSTLSQSLQTTTMVAAIAPAEAIPIPAPVPGPVGAPTGGRTRRAQPSAATAEVAAMTAAASSAATTLGEVLPTQLNLTPLAAEGTLEGAAWRDGVGDAAADRALKSTLARIPIQTVEAALDDPDGFTPVNLMTIERRAQADALRAYLDRRRRTEPGRGPLNEDNPVDWDATPEFYQATSIAHGHLLHFKQEWKADGYSLGELVKSIPLAPGQVKQIAVLDWDREDRAARSESREASERLEARLSRDRDINEIANASFRESIRGGSKTHTEAIAGGLGIGIGPLVIGGAGGASSSSSTAWNEGSRTMVGETFNQLRDEISQGVSAVRSQRASVVQTVSQRERVTATTEAIANFNRCHAMTVQYFEVLRHFAVQERLAGVQECLFVPLRMSRFDDAKVLRWRDALQRACRRRNVRPGFAAIQRLSRAETTPPDRAFADDPIETVSGRLFLRVSIARPKDPEAEAEAAIEQTQWSLLGLVLSVHPEVLYLQYKRDAAKRDRVFRTEIAPEIARQYLESLRVVLIDRDGTEHDANLDLTSLSRYVEGGLMEVALNDAGAVPRLTRRDIVAVQVQTDFALPDYSKVIVERASIDYRTERFDHALYESDRVLDDLLAGDPAHLSTSALSRAEERNQLKEDRERRRRLLRHLNENIEYYHRAIWWRMDSARRFMLLDGFEAPNSEGRSVASVVENRLIGVVGNALVMPVAPGFQLDPALAGLLAAEAADGDDDETTDPLAALSRLYDTAPTTPRRLSVPTKGVFAEAMNGKCNACEVIEDDRFWRWKDFPLPDTPPAIAEVSTDSRFATPGSLTPTGFPDALVKFQTIENAPDPTGLSAALGLLAQDVFKDITGLTANQKNAMAALTASFGAAESFAGEAFKLSAAKDAARSVDRTLDQITQARNAGLLTNAEASQAARDALLRTLGEDPSKANDAATDPSVEEALKQLGTTGGEATVTRSSGGSSETVTLTSEGPAELAIGDAADFEVKDFPDKIVIKTPIIIDAMVGREFKELKSTRDRGKAEKLLELKVDIGGGAKAYVDFLEVLLRKGILERDGLNFQIVAKVRIGYPCVKGDKAKIAEREGGSKYPLAVLVHGNATSYTPVGPFPRFRLTSAGEPILLATDLVSQDNHAGYDYLLTRLAQPDPGIIGISIETNLANLVGSFSDMRAAMILDVLRELKRQAEQPDSFLFGKIDFGNIALMGHSRGGEAVVVAERTVRAANPDPKKREFGIKAVCSLAPTDLRGSSTNAPLVIDDAPDISYFVLYGGLDQDVSGTRKLGEFDQWGNGFRLYDRAKCGKAMAFAPRCCHIHFNTVWEAKRRITKLDGSPGHIEGRFELPDRVLTPTDHQTIAAEYISGFFDCVLNADKGQQVLFDNRKLRTPGAIGPTGDPDLDNILSSLSPPPTIPKPVALQWRFGSTVRPLDDFTSPNPGRILPVGATIAEFAPFVPVVDPRDTHVLHQRMALIIKHSDVGSATARVEFLLNPDGTAFNLEDDKNGFHLISFGLGQLYPVGPQGAIDAVPKPSFTASIVDTNSVASRLPSDELYADMESGWVTPERKDYGLQNRTIFFQQTMTLGFNALRNHMIATGSLLADLNKARSFVLEFDVDPADATRETWLTDVALVKK